MPNGKNTYCHTPIEDRKEYVTLFLVNSSILYQQVNSLWHFNHDGFLWFFRLLKSMIYVLTNVLFILIFDTKETLTLW